VPPRCLNGMAAWEVVGTVVAFSLSKKVALYVAGRVYGFPKIYRWFAKGGIGWRVDDAGRRQMRVRDVDFVYRLIW
jgi:hypothetical protein